MRLLVLSALTFLPFFGTKVTPLSSEFPQPVLHGIDISHHQKRIEWDSVAVQKEVDFVFVKATEGSDYVDTMFTRNWEDLNRVGIKRGAYHFFRAYGCGYDQAQHFLSTVRMSPGDLVPVLDVETLDGVSPETLRTEVGIWLQTVEMCLNVKPIIYTNQKFYDRFLSQGGFKHPLWIARYSDEQPLLTDGRMWHFWQFTNSGCVDGISEKVDINAFNGTEEELNRYCWLPAAP